MICDFAALCGDEENLRELYLLTFCDLASVAPDAMSELEGDAAARAVHAHAGVPAPRARPAARRAREIVAERQKARRAAGRDAGGGSGRTRRCGGCSRGFPTATSPRTRRRASRTHVAPDARAARASARARSSTCRTTRAWASPSMVLAAADTPGLLAEVAGVLYANRIEVVDAAIYSRAAGRHERVAPRRWTCSACATAWARPVTAEARWTKVREDLEAVRVGADQGGDPGRRPAPHGIGRQLEDAGGPDRMQDRQRRQPRLHRRRGDHRGPARRPIRHRARAVRRRGWTSTGRRSRPRPTAPSTSSTCATRRRWTRSSLPSARPACARRCSRCWPEARRRNWPAAHSA